MVTADVIGFHAAERPEAVALVFGGREITYAALDRDVGRFARALAELGVAPGNLVAVGADDPYVHSLLLLAIEQLGACSSSFQQHEGEGLWPLMSRADLVISDPHYTVAPTRRQHRMTGEWLQTVWTLPAAEAPRAPALAERDPVRILRTSGTTGSLKMLFLRRREHEGRLQRYVAEYQFTEASRYFLTIPMNVFHSYGASMACLRSGGTLVLETPQRMTQAEALNAHGITAVTLMPVQLKRLLDGLPDDFRKPQGLTVCTFGAPVSAALQQRTLARLAAVFYRDYGCNEVGLISLSRRSDDTGGGTIWPGVEVEVVDESDVPVPKGEIGRIRVRTEVMLEGYLDDPEATRQKFRDGWFYPGDSGALGDNRHLRVLGRSDELINAGGLKHAPADLESIILQKLPVRDVGVCAIRNVEGYDEVCVAAVTDTVAERDLREGVVAALRNLVLGRIYVMKLDAIPRNEAGKILRDRLRSAAESLVRGGT